MIHNYIYDVESNELVRDSIDALTLSKLIEVLFFDSIDFHEYHQQFAEKVYRVFIRSNGKILGYYILGLRSDQIKLPYSSPFSMVYMRKNYKVKDVKVVVKNMIDCCEKLGCSEIEITLPPEIYNKELINTLSATLFSEGFSVKTVDLNNYYNLSEFNSTEEYIAGRPHMVRKNYKRALRNNLRFKELPKSEFEIAYNVIAINREQMGYPLKLSNSHMREIVNMDSLESRFFVVLDDDEYVAAAIVFDITDEVSQVIYWGDHADYREKRPMTLLTTEVFNEYNRLGKRFLDIGPSSENGIVNTGLADFKMAIGCHNNVKITYAIKLKHV